MGKNKDPNAQRLKPHIVMDGGQDRRGASVAGATFNFIKGMMGAGMLSLPHAIKQVGFGVACSLGVVLMFVCFASMYFLVRAKREANRAETGDQYVGPHVSYKDVAFAAFGNSGRIFLTACITFQQVCFASGWVIVITSTTQTLLPDFPRIAIVCWFWPILVLLSWIRYLKYLVPFSFFGCMVYAVGIIGVTYYYSIPNFDHKHWEAITMWNWSKAPLYMSTLTYAILGIIGVLPNESSLKKPSQANTMVAFSLFFYGINSVLFALAAYVGGFADGDTIVLSLPQNSRVIDVVKACLVFALVMTHPVGCSYAVEPLEEMLFPQELVATKTHPTASDAEAIIAVEEGEIASSSETEGMDLDSSHDDEQSPLLKQPDDDDESSGMSNPSFSNMSYSSMNSITGSIRHVHKRGHVINDEEDEEEKEKNKSWWQRRGRNVVRTIMVTITCVIGYFIPNFSEFSNFVGSIILSMTGLIIPPILYLKLKPNKSWYNYVIAIAISCYGFCFMFIGTYVAVLNVMNKKK